MQILTVTAGQFGQNGYVVLGDSGGAVAIDPGACAADMVRILEERQAKLEAILVTHAHLDHIEGIARLRRHQHAPIWLHPDDRLLYDHVVQQAVAFGLPPIEQPPEPDESFGHGQALSFAGTTFEVLHAPGHAPGHVILYVASEGTAFVGDVIFQGSIGRTDLPGGDFYTLIRSIREQVFTLPEKTKLLTGHGAETSVGWERRTNPFLTPQYGGELA